jgi:tetratricopeptide (TPR) repeat protein
MASAEPGGGQVTPAAAAKYARPGVAYWRSPSGRLPQVVRGSTTGASQGRTALAADPGNAEAQRDLSISYNNLARVLETAGQLGEAERLYREDLAIDERLAAADPGNAQAQRDLSISSNNLARVLVTAGQLGAAERLYRQALAITEQWYGADHQFTRDIRQQLHKLS